MENCVYPHKHLCNKVLYSSLLTSIPGIYAFINGYYIESIVHFLIVFTSINYWKDPRFFSWERYLDKLVVISGLIYLFIRSIKSKNNSIFHKFLILGIICYFLSIYYSKQKQWEYSSNMHTLMHIFINIGIFLLYKPF
jgi:predicted membrane channel-forming protein YqfA (hemolysin III family)